MVIVQQKAIAKVHRGDWMQRVHIGTSNKPISPSLRYSSTLKDGNLVPLRLAHCFTRGYSSRIVS